MTQPGVLDLEVSEVFEKNEKAVNSGKYRFVVNQGGARSSKTVSIAQLIIYLSITMWRDKIITIIRKTLPAVRLTVMKDFLWVLKKNNIYDEKYHNKSDHTYKIFNNEICFSNIDNPQKVRGRKHNIAWFNEANEMSYEDFTQVNMRTTDLVFLDYNPSDEFHWIYEKIIPRPESYYIQSTYKDNPFLEKAIVREIERYRELDEHYWKIYGLGERAMSPNIIYRNYRLLKSFPEPDEVIYGLDFGYNHKAALVEVSVKDRAYYLKELLYESNLTTGDIIRRMDEEQLIPVRTREIYCDNAEPDRIEEIRRAGYNVHPCKKDKNHAAIDHIKSQIFYVHEESINLYKELRSYSWKTDKDGKLLDEVVKVNDDLCDAFRYAIFTHYNRYFKHHEITEEDLRRMNEEYDSRLNDFL